MNDEIIYIDNNYQINLEDFELITKKNFKVKLSNHQQYIDLINKGNQVIQQTIRKNIPIYGVNTGFGDSCRNLISYKYAKKLQENLVSFHGCGIGPDFSAMEGLGMVLLRLISNTKGYSGVTYNLLSQLERFINIPIIPLIPEIGSVGASGDLTPLSYIASALSGKRKVYYKGAITKTSQALEQEKIDPITFEPKEALAILNGTSVMTAISAFAIIDTKRIVKLVELSTAITIEVLEGNKGSFSSFIHQNKPHPGQIKSAKSILNYLSSSSMASSQDEINTSVQSAEINESSNILLKRTIQDKYSLRCAPQIIGVLWDTIKWVEEWITIEMNSVNDNPLVDYETETIYKGGNFYGGHVCMGMDSLRSGIANIADLIDKQIALLVDEKFSNGLPGNLVSQKDDHFINHGFKGMQISGTALTVEINHLAQPISILSRPTESLNQDKVSLGTISARYTRNVIRLIEHLLAIQLLSLCQAIEIRGGNRFSESAKKLLVEVRKSSPFVEEDRELDEDIINIVNLVQSDVLTNILQ